MHTDLDNKQKELKTSNKDIIGGIFFLVLICGIIGVCIYAAIIDTRRYNLIKKTCYPNVAEGSFTDQKDNLYAVCAGTKEGEFIFKLTK